MRDTVDATEKLVSNCRKGKLQCTMGIEDIKCYLKHVLKYVIVCYQHMFMYLRSLVQCSQWPGCTVNGLGLPKVRVISVLEKEASLCEFGKPNPQIKLHSKMPKREGKG